MDLLRQVKRERNGTNADIGRAVDRTAKTVSTWFTRRRAPEPHLLPSLLDYLHISRDQFNDPLGYAARRSHPDPEPTDAEFRLTEDQLDEALGALVTAYDVFKQTLTIAEMERILSPVPALNKLHTTVMFLAPVAHKWRRMRQHPCRARERQAAIAPLVGQPSAN